MTIHRGKTVAAALVALASLTGVASAQEAQKPPAPTPPRVEQRFETREPAKTAKPAPPVEIPPEQRDESYYRRPVLRLFQSYTLPQGDATRQIVSVLADVRIDGTVHGDVSVTLGNATLGSTAVIEGALVVVGGSATVQPGAKVGGDVVVIGGTLDSPVDFVPGGEHVVLGTPAIGDSLRALSPWLTRGLLFGRLIVPNLGWVWMIVLISFFLGLILNQMFARQVGACADTLSRRPGGTFFVGLLVILLAGPAMVIVAITVIGLPFALVALIAACVIGKLGVTRAIGRGIVHESEPGNRAQALRSYVIGAAAVTFAYMVPVLGLLTWALISVFGLGTATMTFMASLRRERPAPPPAAPVEPPPVVPPPAVPPPPVPASDLGVPASGAAAFSEPATYASPPAGDVFREEPPLPPTVPPGPPETGTAPPAAVHATGLLGYPRATFLDRLAAIAIDAILVAIFNSVIVDSFLFYRLHGDGSYFAVLLVYHIAFWAWKGTTLGGIICNLRMVRTTGDDPRFIDALVRGLTAIFSAAALGIGCFWMLNDPERQMWHDKIAGTVVVKVPRELVLR